MSKRPSIRVLSTSQSICHLQKLSLYSSQSKGLTTLALLSTAPERPVKLSSPLVPVFLEDHK